LTWLLCGSLVLAAEAAEDSPALDLRLGEVSGGVVGSGAGGVRGCGVAVVRCSAGHTGDLGYEGESQTITAAFKTPKHGKLTTQPVVGLAEPLLHRAIGEHGN